MNVYRTSELTSAMVAPRADRPATSLVHDASDARIMLFRIEPGQDVPVHTSVSTVVLAIVSGSGVVVGRGGEEREVRVGDIVAYDADEPHGMRAAGSERFVVAAVIAPRPRTR